MTRSSSSRAGRSTWSSTAPAAVDRVADGAHIRAAAGAAKLPLLTTAAAGLAAADGMADRARHALQVRPLQEYLRGVGAHELEPRIDQPTLPDMA